MNKLSNFSDFSDYVAIHNVDRDELLACAKEIISEDPDEFADIDLTDVGGSHYTGSDQFLDQVAEYVIERDQDYADRKVSDVIEALDIVRTQYPNLPALSFFDAGDGEKERIEHATYLLLEQDDDDGGFYHAAVNFEANSSVEAACDLLTSFVHGCNLL